MRLVTPNQFIRRQALEDVARGEHTIRAGDAVLLILAAANRDPEAFPEPCLRQQLQRAVAAFSAGCHGLSWRVPVKFRRARPGRRASLRSMMMIFLVRRVRATAVGLAPAGSVLG